MVTLNSLKIKSALMEKCYSKGNKSVQKMQVHAYAVLVFLGLGIPNTTDNCCQNQSIMVIQILQSTWALPPFIFREKQNLPTKTNDLVPLPDPAKVET